MSLVASSCVSLSAVARSQRSSGHAEGPDGAAEAFAVPQSPEQVFAEYAPRILGLARRMVRNEADAEDVAQDVLLLVVRKLDTFRGESSFATWIHRVTTNAALLHRRKRALIREKADHQWLEYTAPDGAQASPSRRGSAAPDEQAASREERQLLNRAIARLPRLYREAYVLGEVEGVPNAEIALRLGLSVPAVKSRLHRAKALLRRALAPHFENAPAC